MLDWVHYASACDDPKCQGDKECENFPTIADRVAQAQAAYGEYSESDGTAMHDFLVDVLHCGENVLGPEGVFEAIDGYEKERLTKWKRIKEDIYD